MDNGKDEVKPIIDKDLLELSRKALIGDDKFEEEYLSEPIYGGRK